MVWDYSEDQTDTVWLFRITDITKVVMGEITLVRQSEIMYGWMYLVRTLALLAIVTTAFRLMLDVVKACEAATQLAVIVAVVILLILLPVTCFEAWNALSHWQKIGLVVLGITALTSVQNTRRNAQHRRRR